MPVHGRFKFPKLASKAAKYVHVNIIADNYLPLANLGLSNETA